MNKILAIIRTSTERQETESQKFEVKNFCISKGYKEKDIIYIETSGASARKINEKYLQMLESIKTTIAQNKDIKAVALWHINRLGRVEEKLLEMKNYFIANKIQVYIKEPSMTLLNEDGTVNTSAEISWSLFATMVKHDTAELMAKLERGRNDNRRKGKFNGGAYGALYGYMVDENKYIQPCPSEAEKINEIYRIYASGKYSIKSLVKELKQRGETIRGRKITENNIAKILSNTAYIGYSREHERKYYPIIDKELWEKVEQIRKQNDLNIRKTKESKNINLAIKLLKCAHCGHNYVATKNKYTCYKHVMKQRFDDDCLNSVAISINLMDMLLWNVAYLKHLDYVQSNKGIETEQMEERKRILNIKIETAKKEIESLDERKERANELYVNMEITRKKYDEMKAKTAKIENGLQTDIKLYKKEIKAIESKMESLNNNDEIERLVNIALGLDQSNKKEMKEIVNQHIKECNVERVSFDGKKAIKIIINCYDGSVWKYMYFYTYKQKEKQLYILNSDGKLFPYYTTDENRESARKEIVNNNELLKAQIYIIAEMINNGKMDEKYLFSYLDKIERERYNKVINEMANNGTLIEHSLNELIEKYNENRLLKDIQNT